MEPLRSRFSRIEITMKKYNELVLDKWHSEKKWIKTNLTTINVKCPTYGGGVSSSMPVRNFKFTIEPKESSKDDEG